jgi:hypothetical protein
MSISSVAESKLEKAVAAILESHTEPGRTIDDVLRDLFYGGCASGAISDLVYFDETIPFYEEHKGEINKLLAKLAEDGMSVTDLPGWETDDPLALEYMNQHALAWFGFEKTARILADRIGLEY